MPQADCPHRLWWDVLSMPPGYIDTSLPVHEPSGMNSQEFDTDDQDFRTGPTKPGLQRRRRERSSGETGSDRPRFPRTETLRVARHTARVRRDPNRRGVDDDMKTEVRFSFAGPKPRSYPRRLLAGNVRPSSADRRREHQERVVEKPLRCGA